jgi:hypothetical protein
MPTTATRFSFDPEKHVYTIGGRAVPSVTQIIAAVFGPPKNAASEWHKERGVAIHACCAMIAKKINFDFDERISGQIDACHKWFRDFEVQVVETEIQGYSEPYCFAGTADLICWILQADRKYIIDWKSSFAATEPIQLAAYGILFNVDWGMSVELHEDGKYRCSEEYNLKRWKQRWMSVLSTYNTRKELGI